MQSLPVWLLITPPTQQFRERRKLVETVLSVAAAMPIHHTQRTLHFSSHIKIASDPILSTLDQWQMHTHTPANCMCSLGYTTRLFTSVCWRAHTQNSNVGNIHLQIVPFSLFLCISPAMGFYKVYGIYAIPCESTLDTNSNSTTVVLLLLPHFVSP